MKEKIRSVVLGHAIGDALGVPVEFASRIEMDNSPVEDMEEGGTYNMPKGTWSDDTSMSLAALDSLSNNVIDYDDMMDNFCDWFNKAKYTDTFGKPDLSEFSNMPTLSSGEDKNSKQVEIHSLDSDNSSMVAFIDQLW